MPKLFALETDNNDDDPLDKRNELLIDKVLDYEKKTKSDASVTADLLKQRHDLRKEITIQLKEHQEEQENADEDSDTSNDTEQENSTDPQTDSPAGTDTDPPKDTTPADDPDDAPKDKAANGDESDESSAADDVDSLRAMVSGKPATEGFKPVFKPTFKKMNPLSSVVGMQAALRGMFQPLKDSHNKRMIAIEDFLLGDKPKATDQPLVYVADEVMESLNRMIAVAQQYILKNTSTSEQAGEGLKTIGEKLTVYREFINNGKFHFSQVLIQEEDLLKPLSLTGKNELAYTSTVLSKYLEGSSALAVKLMQNPFAQINDAMLSAGYKHDGQGVYASGTALPGFNVMQASVVPFTDYVNTKYEEYQVYKLQTFKPNDLYSLPALSLDEDKDVKKLLNELDKILMSAGLIVDNLKDMTAQYQSFIDSAKTIVYDVQKGTQTDLAGLGLDEKMKDFIKFKLVTELYINDLDSSVQYLSASLTALSRLVELSDK